MTKIKTQVVPVFHEKFLRQTANDVSQNCSGWSERGGWETEHYRMAKFTLNLKNKSEKEARKKHFGK